MGFAAVTEEDEPASLSPEEARADTLRPARPSDVGADAERSPGTPAETTDPDVSPPGIAGAAADSAGAGGERVAWHRRPVPTMFKSVLVPGWGQWSNGKHVKAGVILAAEGYLIYRAARAARNEWDAEDLGLEAEAEAWNGERRDYTWWLLFAVVLSMGDAYVDAHLRGFDLEFEPKEAGGGRVGLRWTF